MRLLNGLELAGYIKERQAKQVRVLRQAHHVQPRLAIVRSANDPVITSYIKLKKAYGADILIDVEDHLVEQSQILELISKLNQDETVHGIIVQLPLIKPAQTDEIINAVAPQKDVDGLSQASHFDPATPLSIIWLLAGYNIDLRGKTITVVGQGRLVGRPLTQMLQKSGYTVNPVDRSTEDLRSIVHVADVIIAGTGVPGLITSDMIKPGAVVVDAGVATDAGKLVGDLAPDVRERHDLTITPPKGGVGPLTVCALFDNVIRAARATVKS